MTTYIVRVELHDAGPADYDSLHIKMQQAGFSRQIKSSDNRYYQLPPAEYAFIGVAGNAVGVRQSAKIVASSVKRSNAVLVSETTTVAWDGLKETTTHPYGSVPFTGAYGLRR